MAKDIQQEFIEQNQQHSNDLIHQMERVEVYKKETRAANAAAEKYNKFVIETGEKNELLEKEVAANEQTITILQESLAKSMAEVAALKEVVAAEERWVKLHKAACEGYQEEVAALKEQLPEGMTHCTIRFIECPKGHGRLTADNWVDHGCGVCERDRLAGEVERLKKDFEIQKNLALIYLAQDRRLREALEEWTCRECNGTGKMAVERCGDADYKCRACSGHGIHPIAHRALSGGEGEGDFANAVRDLKEGTPHGEQDDFEKMSELADKIRRERKRKGQDRGRIVMGTDEPREAEDDIAYICPECRTGFTTGIAVDTWKGMCPDCDVELEPWGREAEGREE
jgi:hypothetical protein